MDKNFYLPLNKYLDAKSIHMEEVYGNDSILVGDDIPDIDIPTDSHTYKVLVANSNTKVGKPSRYRIICYVVKGDKEIYLITSLLLAGAIRKNL